MYLYEYELFNVAEPRLKVCKGTCRSDPRPGRNSMTFVLARLMARPVHEQSDTKLSISCRSPEECTASNAMSSAYIRAQMKLSTPRHVWSGTPTPGAWSSSASMNTEQRGAQRTALMDPRVCIRSFPHMASLAPAYKACTAPSM
jgi:hypothetical protein